MKKRNLLFLCNGDKTNIYQYGEYCLPIAMGGSQKNLIQNVSCLKNDFDIKIAIYDIGNNIKNIKSDFEIISLNKNFEKNLAITPLINELSKNNPFNFEKRNDKNLTIIVNNGFLSALIIKIYKPKAKIVLILEGTFFFLSWSKYLTNIFTRILYFILSIISIFIVDKIIVDNKRNMLNRIFIKSLKNKTTFLPNSIDRNLYEKSNGSFKPEVNEKILLYVGRLDFEAQKNPELLFKSFDLAKKQNPYLRLTIIGIDNEKLKYFSNRFKIQDLSNITCIKEINNEELIPYYKMADLTLLSSRFEGTPYVILESLACGTPCISTNVIDEGLIINGENGYICNDFNPKSYSDLIIKGLSLSETIKKEKKKLLDDIYNIKYRKKNLLKIIS